MADQRSIDQFRKYLRIKCVHPNPDYEESIQFIVQYLKDFGFVFGFFYVYIIKENIFKIKILLYFYYNLFFFKKKELKRKLFNFQVM